MAGDASYPSVILLLHGDGANGATTTTDKSATPKTITFTGGAKISTAQSKFGGAAFSFPGGSGTTDYVDAANSSDFNFTGDYTVEFFAYWNSTPATKATNLFSVNVTNGLSIYWDSGQYVSNCLVVSNNAVNNPIAQAWVPALATWYHIAVSRSGTTTRAFIDGVLLATATMSTNHPAADVRIGGFGAGSSALQTLDGYIDEVRVTKGLARYTANFAPPAAPFPDGIGQVSGAVTDSSGAAATRVVRAYRRDTGALVKEIYTCAPDPYISGVSLLLNGNGANGANVFTDNSPAPLTPTLIGAPTISTAQSKYGGSSMHFGGTADALQYAHTPALNLAVGDFTIEGWVYVTSLANTCCVCQKDQSFGSTFVSYAVLINSSGGLAGSVGTGNTNTYSQNLASANGLVSTNTWHHIAFTRHGTTLTLWLDGVSVATAVQTGSPLDGGKVMMIGRYPSGGGSADEWFPGYIDDFRITKGLARYTAAFTPPALQMPGANAGTAIGAYSFYTPTLDELMVLALDPATNDPLYDDVVIRVIPA